MTAIGMTEQTNVQGLHTARLDLATGWLTGLRRGEAVVLSLAFLAVVTFADVVTPRDYNFGPLYFLTVCIASWSVGLTGGYVVGIVCAVIWTSVQMQFLHDLGPIVWNTLTRATINCVIAALIGSLRRAYDREHSMARTDGLTGALNRRAFHEAIQHMLERARRKGDVIVVSYVDLDGFKGVNDTYGHAAGDAVLGAFAAAARLEVGEHGALARVGGDEFVLVQRCQVDDDHFAAAEARHERLTEALRALPYDVTCSMGVVISKGGMTDKVRLIAFADALLYEVKRSGKNALRIAETTESDEPTADRRLAAA